MHYVGRRLSAVTVAMALSVAGGAAASPAFADPRETHKNATASGYGGAVSTVDPEASAAAIDVLRKGGNAADAAVAAAATLGVTEPYSAGSRGGYFVYYDAKTGKVGTVDGRETAPATMPHDAFIDPATGQPYRFTPELVTSGVAVGVPGTPATWQRALQRWGSLSLGEALGPAIKVATRGFVVDGPSASRRSTTRPALRPSPRPAPSSSPAATLPPSAASSKTMTSPPLTGSSRNRARTASTEARSRRTSLPPCRLRQRLPAPPCRFRRDS